MQSISSAQPELPQRHCCLPLRSRSTRQRQQQHRRSSINIDADTSDTCWFINYISSSSCSLSRNKTNFLQMPLATLAIE
ncbi:hypothetical protein ACLKA6_006536 [Drosophila palustris]